MACIISISQEPDGFWMMKNSTYEWFIGLVTQRYQDDADMSSELWLSVYMNGIEFDHLYEKNPDLARRTVAALHGMAKEVADGQHIPINEDVPLTPETQKEYTVIFTKLCVMLENFSNTIL